MRELIKEAKKSARTDRWGILKVEDKDNLKSAGVIDWREKDGLVILPDLGFRTVMAIAGKLGDGEAVFKKEGSLPCLYNLGTGKAVPLNREGEALVEEAQPFRGSPLEISVD